MLDDRLPRSEGAGDAGGAAARDREECIDDALSRSERDLRRQALDDGTRAADGPALEQLDLVLFPLFVHDDRDCLFDGELAAFDLFYLSADAVRDHYPVIDEHGLLNGADNVSGAGFVALFKQGLKGPLAGPAYRGNADPS